MPPQTLVGSLEQLYLPDDAMNFTGERYCPTEQGRIRLEHYHRYASVLEVVSDKDVLDLASGEGYGSSLLANSARSVVAVDISAEAIRHAQLSYPHPKLFFCTGSASTLAFDDAAFDAVISFETIEHLPEQEQMISEIRRVLRPNGFLIISTPNRPVYSEESDEHNHYHVKELDLAEFDQLLRSQFTSIRYFGQRLSIGSVIQEMFEVTTSFRAWQDDGLNLYSDAPKMENPVYFLAVCSSNEISLPHLGASVLYPTGLDLVKHYVGFAKWAKSLDHDLAERDRQLLEAKGILERLGVRLDNRSALPVGRDDLIYSLTRELDSRNARIEAMLNSRSWRISAPIRVTTEALRSSRIVVVALLSSVWRRLPLPAELRTRAKCALFRFSAPIFRGTPAYTHWLNQRLPEAAEDALEIGDAAIDQVHPDPIVENLRIPGGVALDPMVSVIVPVYNKLNYTLACLDGIARQMPQANIEVLVIDDGSTDATEVDLSARQDIRYLRNETNLGFIGSCNRGAREAKGHFLFFLNNDTVVTEGWLDHLLKTFENVPKTGLVGSKLIYPNGRLQEAGGIIWSDGSGWNWGRMADPSSPEFNFLRDVDYCSGAAILIRRDLFDEIGGFDERYAPAYYEDTDLAFAVRAKGLRVIYQPLSAIIHYEGITSGTDLASGIKAYQIRNQQRFRDKWNIELASHGDHLTQPPRLSADRNILARILVIDACTPTPDQDSGSLDMWNYLRILTGFGYRVTFVPAYELIHRGAYTTALQSLGVECLYRPHVGSVDEVLDTRGSEFHAVMLVRVVVAYPLIAKVKECCPQAAVIFNTVDLHFLREERQAKLHTGASTSPEATQTKRHELAVISVADTTIVVSPFEQSLLAQEMPDARVRVIPILRETPGRCGSLLDRDGIVFVGGFRHPPNVDAIVWFCDEIWPLIRPQLPGAKLSIIGSNIVSDVENLARADVEILGFVENLQPVFARARLSVAPLRYGAGQKGKVVTSLGFGVPCVATPIAAEGLSLGHECGVLVEEEPAAFADAVVRIYQDPDLWQRLSDGGLELVEREFSLNTNRIKLVELLAELGLPVPM